MKYAPIILAVMLLAVTTLTGCGKNTVVLLEGPDGKVGHVIVTPREGAPVELTQARQAVDVSAKDKADPVFTMTEQQVRKTFGGALDAEPTPPLKFMLHFESDSTALKPESEPLLAQIIAAVKERMSTDVSVIGHTDRAGDKQYNLDLSTQRAKKIAKILQDGGIDPNNMEINSHGENNPIVPTKDGEHNTLNRRVEVTVR